MNGSYLATIVMLLKLVILRDMHELATSVGCLKFPVLFVCQLQ